MHTHIRVNMSSRSNTASVYRGANPHFHPSNSEPYLKFEHRTAVTPQSATTPAVPWGHFLRSCLKKTMHAPSGTLLCVLQFDPINTPSLSLSVCVCAHVFLPVCLRILGALVYVCRCLRFIFCCIDFGKPALILLFSLICSG